MRAFQKRMLSGSPSVGLGVGQQLQEEVGVVLIVGSEALGDDLTWTLMSGTGTGVRTIPATLMSSCRPFGETEAFKLPLFERDQIDVALTVKAP